MLAESIPARRVLVGGLDRKDAASSNGALEVATKGAYVALDHVGLNDDAAHLTDEERADLVLELVDAGHADKILLSSNAIGVAKGQPDYDLPFSYVAATFVPQLVAKGLSADHAQHILESNPRDLLTVAPAHRADQS